MDRELLGDEGFSAGDDGIVSKDDTIVCTDTKEENKEVIGNAEVTSGWGEHLGLLLKIIIDHFFPRFNEWLSEVPDRRDQESIKHLRKTILWTGLLLFLLKLGSRSQIRYQMRNELFCKNVALLSGEEKLPGIPHDDTLIYFMEGIEIPALEQLQVKIMSRLFTQRVFDRYRLPGGYLPIAIDGVHIHSFDYKHCDECLHKTDATTGVRIWYHLIVKASLVLPNKMCLPLATEWLTNEDGETKQDCEKKAVKRLIRKLRKYYPKLRIGAVLDSLFCDEPMFKALEDAQMAWIVVFKEGSMSEVYKWIHDGFKRTPAEEHTVEVSKEIEDRSPRLHEDRFKRKKKAVHKTKEIVTKKHFTWKRGIVHWNNDRKYNYLSERVKTEGNDVCSYEWLVSDTIAQHITKGTVEEIADNGGRCRWKIENEGNNVQKNGGYELEHLYCKHPKIMKMFVCLLDSAHTINQLIEKGFPIVRKVLGSFRNIARRLLEDLRTRVFSMPEVTRKIQIRLAGCNTS